MSDYACLLLPFPLSVNNLFVNNARTRGRFKSARYKAWENEATQAIRRQEPIPVFSDPVRVTYSIGKPDNRKRDLGNLEKSVSDALVANGILTDDSLIEDLRLRWDSDVTGCLIEIETLGDMDRREQAARLTA